MRNWKVSCLSEILTLASEAGISLMRQAPVLAESDTESESGRIAVKLQNMSQAGVLVQNILAEDESDARLARSIWHGKFHCWEVSRQDNRRFCLPSLPDNLRCYCTV